MQTLNFDLREFSCEEALAARLADLGIAHKIHIADEWTRDPENLPEHIYRYEIDPKYDIPENGLLFSFVFVANLCAVSDFSLYYPNDEVIVY